MTRIIVNGACGHMGRNVLSQLAESYRDCSLAAAVDRMGSGDVYVNIEDFQGEADVIVDFSHHSAVHTLLAYAMERRLPLVIATTGHDEAELIAIQEAAKQIPIFHSANMSLGVALFVQLAVESAAVFPDADIEIIETHHNRKLDAPSGTALMLGKAIQGVRKDAYFHLGRQGQGKREPAEIGFHAVRCGNVVGKHEIILSTATQTITITHEAHDRALFAQGALAAAVFLQGCPAGHYDMQDMIKAK